MTEKKSRPTVWQTLGQLAATLVFVGLVALLLFAGRKTGVIDALDRSFAEQIRQWKSPICEVWTEASREDRLNMILAVMGEEKLSGRIDPNCAFGVTDEIIRDMNRACYEYPRLRDEKFESRIRESFQRLCP
jgi:hypothetical protein